MVFVNKLATGATGAVLRRTVIGVVSLCGASWIDGRADMPALSIGAVGGVSPVVLREGLAMLLAGTSKAELFNKAARLLGAGGRGMVLGTRV